MKYLIEYELYQDDKLLIKNKIIVKGAFDKDDAKIMLGIALSKIRQFNHIIIKKCSVYKKKDGKSELEGLMGLLGMLD